MRTIKPRSDSNNCGPGELACGDFALAQLSDGSFIVGSAPFKHSREPAQEGASFYVNDFALSEAKPWRIPAVWMRFNSIDELSVKDCSPAQMDWKEPEFLQFRKIFESIQLKLLQGSLVKAVPVVSARSTLNENSNMAGSLVRSASSDVQSASLCAFQEGGSGFVVLTPERLIKIDGMELETMALAGTATSSNCDEFARDPKEQKEHLLVVDALKNALSALGDVTESDREIMDLGGMIHFLSRFSVKLLDIPLIDEVINTLHPTPAVGVVPRGRGFAKELCSLRAESEIPDAFGAPFGVKFGDCFESFVLIRGIFWNGNDAFLPSGCGLLRESVLQREWDELALKRDWVKEAFAFVNQHDQHG